MQLPEIRLEFEQVSIQLSLSRSDPDTTRLC